MVYIDIFRKRRKYGFVAGGIIKKGDSYEMIKAMLILGLIGHLLCAMTDVLIIFAKDGKRFDFKLMSDNEKMSEVMEHMPLNNPMLSILLGVLAIFIMIWGYFGVCMYVYTFSKVYAAVLFVSTLMCMIPITAFHVFCGTAEWYYIRLERTEESRVATVDFFKRILPTGIVSYLGLLAFCVTLFIIVLSGVTEIPVWAFLFNHIIFIIPLQCILKVPGAGNLAGALTFLGLLFVI